MTTRAVGRLLAVAVALAPLAGCGDGAKTEVPAQFTAPPADPPTASAKGKAPAKRDTTTEKGSDN